VIVSDSYLAQHRDVVQRFLDASERGWRFALEHPEQAVKATLARDPHLDAADQTEMMAALRPYIRKESSMFKMDPAVWESIGEALAAQGLLTHPADVIHQLCDYTLAK